MPAVKRLVIFFVLVAAAMGCAPDFQVYDLKCEALKEPLGIDSASPHFSWKISASEPIRQEAWEIQVASSSRLLSSGRPDLWDSGLITGPDQIMVPYAGSSLVSRQLCWWRVRVWDQSGKKSSWSRPQRFAVGVISPDSLRGEYIGTGLSDGTAPMLRGRVNLESRTRTAFLHVNSLGTHEVYVNGVRVGDAVLQPAVSQLDKRSLIVTYDVTDLLHKGANEVTIHAGIGWYRPHAFGLRHTGPFVKAELDVLDGSGWKCVLCTDSTWEWAWGGYGDKTPFRGNCIETIDAGAVPVWAPVVTEDIVMEATGQMCEPCRVQETICAETVLQENDSTWVVDLGRVVNGLLEVALPQSPRGTVVRVQFFDVPFDEQAPWRKDYGAMELISSGREEGDAFKSKFNSNVIRYIRFTGLRSAPDPASVKVHRVRTDYSEASSFKCSDPALQSIHDLVLYTMQNLAFHGYMVDCANLERLGYGGDGNASTLSLQTMFDVAPLYMNWLQAWNDAIQPDGGLPHTAPEPWAAGGGPYWCSFIVQAPWRTYMSYGDSRMIERCYPNMKKWLGYVDTYSVGGLLRRWPETPIGTGIWATGSLRMGLT